MQKIFTTDIVRITKKNLVTTGMLGEVLDTYGVGVKDENDQGFCVVHVFEIDKSITIRADNLTVVQDETECNDDTPADSDAIEVKDNSQVKHVLVSTDRGYYNIETSLDVRESVYASLDKGEILYGYEILKDESCDINCKISFDGTESPLTLLLDSNEINDLDSCVFKRISDLVHLYNPHANKIILEFTPRDNYSDNTTYFGIMGVYTNFDLRYELGIA